MPRCPNGTRKNKTTRICESKLSHKLRCPNGTRKNKDTRSCENIITLKKRKLELKLRICLDNLEKIKRHKNATQQYFKLNDKRTDLENQIKNLDENHLTEEEVLDIIKLYKIDEKEKDEIKRKLLNLTYDNKYINCFTGKKSLNLYSMATDKLSCFLKYGDEI